MGFLVPKSVASLAVFQLLVVCGNSTSPNHCRRDLAKLSVCLSVCSSVKRVDCDQTEERTVQIFVPYERSFSLVF